MDCYWNGHSQSKAELCLPAHHFIRYESHTKSYGIHRITSFQRYREVGRINPLTPNDPYSGRTASLTSKRCILYIYSTNIFTEYFKHGIYSSFFFKVQFVS